VDEESVLETTAISVVIPTYGRDRVLVDTVEGLLGLATPPADIVHALQRRDAAPLVALELGAHRVVVDQQRGGDLRWAPTTAEQNYGVQPIRLTDVARSMVSPGAEMAGDFVLRQL
jgi:hypothetical protein